MTVQLTDKELKALVTMHVNYLIGVDEDRLKVSFTKRSTLIDTTITILDEGELTSIIEPTEDSPAEEPNNNNISAMLN